MGEPTTAPPGLSRAGDVWQIADPKSLKSIVVVSNYRGLLQHLASESGLEIRYFSLLKAMVHKYEKRVLRQFIGEHIRFVDLASNPQSLQGLGGRALPCIRNKVRCQTAQHYPVVVLVRK